MAEKIHPKQPIPTQNSNPNPSFPPNKSNLYNSTRPVYRPLPRRNRRSCCCSFCLCITFSLILIILIAAIAGGIFYALYRPQRPSFTVTSLQVQNFTLTNSNLLTTKFNLSVTAHNPNKKIEFIYDQVNVNFRSKDVGIGYGTIPEFTLRKKNTTRLRSAVSVTGQSVGDDGSVLRSDVNKKKVPMSVRLDTKVKVKVGGLKMKKVPIRVDCSGITASVPTGKTPGSASTSGVKIYTMKSLLSFILFLVFIIHTASAADDVVYDVSGNKVLNNVPYHIGPVVWAKGGGVKLTDKKNNNKICPFNVVQDPAEVNIGGKFSFTLVGKENYLKTSRILGIDSGSAKSGCDASTFWQINDAEAKAPKNLITTGGLFDTAASCFQIVQYPKPTSPKIHSYMLQHCPYFCGAGPHTCFNVSVVVDHGVRYLASSGTPFEFVFKKIK